MGKKAAIELLYERFSNGKKNCSKNKMCHRFASYYCEPKKRGVKTSTGREYLSSPTLREIAQRESESESGAFA